MKAAETDALDGQISKAHRCYSLSLGLENSPFCSHTHLFKTCKGRGEGLRVDTLDLFGFHDWLRAPAWPCSSTFELQPTQQRVRACAHAFQTFQRCLQRKVRLFDIVREHEKNRPRTG